VLARRESIPNWRPDYASGQCHQQSKADLFRDREKLSYPAVLSRSPARSRSIDGLGHLAPSTNYMGIVRSLRAPSVL
jgi:hypothetical protein